MKSTGITRRIDDLGRIVIPKEIRKNLKIKENEVLEIFINNDEIILKKFSPFNDSEKVLSDYIKVINDMTGNDVIITDRDKVILSTKKLEEKLLNKKLSEYVNDLIENRSIFLSNDMKGIEVIDNEKIKQKYKLREEIIYTSQAIIEELKDRIDKIVRIYEVEKV